VSKLLKALDNGVLATAEGMSRRRLFRNAGGVAFGAALTTAFMGTEHAHAHADHACGPSPMCPRNRCRDQQKARCKDVRDGVQWRYYNGSTCVGFSGNTASHCWTAQAHGHTWRCCDCCIRVPNYSPTSCSGCAGGQWSTCICGKRIS